MSNPYQDLNSDYCIGAIHGYIQHAAIIHHISFELQLVNPNQKCYPKSKIFIIDCRSFSKFRCSVDIETTTLPSWPRP